MNQPSWFARLTACVLLITSLFQASVWVADPHADAVLLEALVLACVMAWGALGVPAVVKGDVSACPRSVGWTTFGVIALAATWSCLAVLFLERGALYLFSLLVVIWVADIAAYFGGKAFGRRKLASRISPGKTIEGALFGVSAVVAWVIISAQWPHTFGAELVRVWGGVAATGFAVLLAALSIVGDLFESLLKRRATVKDSSHLLPGHGGVLDRIDAVIAVVPLAFALTEFL